MLELMRKKANSWVMTLIFSIIILVFIVNFGPWAGHNNINLTYAAEVNGHPITFTELNQVYANQIRQMQAYNPNFHPDETQIAGFKKMILEQMISRELLAQAAQSNGLSISDKVLTDFIRKNLFGDPKNFTAEQYKQIVHNVFQTTESQFEAQVKHDLLAQQAVTIVSSIGAVSNEETLQAFLDKNNKVTLEYVKINPAELPRQAAPSQAAIDAYIKAHPVELRTYYDKNVSQYRSDKQVRARHILIKSSPSASENDKKAARAKIEAAQKRVAAGEDFAKVASEVSEDGSKSNGGDLGYFPHGAMVPAFEEAAFKLEPGKVSDIVETQFGYHLIKVEDIKMPTHREFETVQPEIATHLLEEEAQKTQAKNLAEQTLTKLKNAKSFNPTVTAGLNTVKATVQSTGNFAAKARYIPGIGDNPLLAKDAFNANKDAPVLDKVYEVNGKFVIAVLKDKETADMAKYEENKATLATNLLRTKRNQLTQQYVDFLKSQAKIKYNPSLEVAPS